MKRELLPLVLLLLLLPAVSAEQITNPKLVKQMDVQVSDEGSITAVGGSMSNLTLNITIPQDTLYQDVDYSGQTVTDLEGNQIAVLTDKNPSNPFTYRVMSRGTIYERTTDSIPEEYTVYSALSAYLAPSSVVQSDDDAVRAAAEEASKGALSDWEKAARIAAYVHDNIEYDSSLVGERKDAKWVLENKRGVCAEYSTLFVAMCRSVGIPARFVSGYSFGENMIWQSHSWAEVYLGKWVPVDPTWLEAGHLDATHVATSKSAESGSENNLVAFTSPGTSLDWQGFNNIGGTTNAVSVNNLVSSEPYPAYSLYAGSSELEANEETIIVLEVTGWDYRVLDLALTDCVGQVDLLEVVSEERDYTVLSPGQKKYVAWRVRVSDTLPQGYLYTCPLTLNSAYLADGTADVELSPSSSSDVSFDAWVSSSTVEKGKEQTIHYRVDSTVPGASVGVVTEDHLEKTSAVQGEGSFSLEAARLGENKAWVYSTTGGVKELSFNVVDNVSLSLKDIIFPSMVQKGELIPLKVIVSNKGTAEEDIRVRITLGAQVQTATATAQANGDTVYDTQVPALNPGSFNLVVEVMNGETSTLQKPITVYEIPDVNITNASYSWPPGEEKTYGVFNLETHGSPRDIVMKVNNEWLTASGNTVEGSVSPGNQSVTIQWFDELGNNYTKVYEAYIPSRDELETVLNIPFLGETKLGFYLEKEHLLFAAFMVILLIVGLQLIIRGFRKQAT